MAPSDEMELKNMLKTAVSLGKPVAIRYPRGTGLGADTNAEAVEIPVGKAEIKKSGEDLYILAIGNTVYPSLKASEILSGSGIKAGVVNMRFIKPLDTGLILSLLNKVKRIAVVEENSCIGGLNSAVCELLAGMDVKIIKIGIPDIFIEHGSQNILREKYGLTAEKIAQSIKSCYC